MATGTGKTFTAVNIVSNKGRVLWGTHTEELIDQSAIALLAELEMMPYNDLLDIFNQYDGLIGVLSAPKSDARVRLISEKIGVVKAEFFDIQKPIVMASMQTLHRRLDRIPSDHFDVVVVDECHYSGANTWKKALDHFTPKLRLGLTATPYRTDGMLMGDIFDEIVYEYNIDSAIKDGSLCELDAIRVKTNISLDKIRTVGGDLNQGDLEEIVNTDERNGLIVQKYKEYADGRQFIAFCVDVKHAQDLCSKFNENGIKTNFIVGNKDLTTDRRGTIESFKSGEYMGLTNVMVLTAGFDHRDTGAVLMCCPTKSLTKYLQQVGRGTRLKSDSFIQKFGQNCIILDFVDTTSRHQLINTWELDKRKDPKDRVFITKEKQLKLIVDRERRMQAGVYNDEKINLFKLPTVKIYSSIRMQEPATEKQLAFISRFGYDVVNVNYTKEMCSQIINSQPATNAQIYALQKEGYDVSNGVTITEAMMAFKEIEARKAKANAERLKKENKFPYSDIK